MRPLASDDDRRRFQRFALPSMYSHVAVRPADSADSEAFEWEGHAYDISPGGVRFELDQEIRPGTPVAMRIDLPHTSIERSTERRSVYVFANVVWVEEDDAPGPVRMAAVFTRFEREGDEALLRERLASGRYAAAA